VSPLLTFERTDDDNYADDRLLVGITYRIR